MIESDPNARLSRPEEAPLNGPPIHYNVLLSIAAGAVGTVLLWVIVNWRR
jgi:hypothetical protein